MTTPRRYQSRVSDSARWRGFRFRDGDIVLSVPQARKRADILFRSNAESFHRGAAGQWREVLDDLSTLPRASPTPRPSDLAARIHTGWLSANRSAEPT